MTDKFVRFFKDKKGRVVIFQRPNLLISVWAVVTLLGKATDNSLQNLLGLVAYGAIFAWAWLEVSQGASYFRRVLGLVVLVVSIKSRI